MCYNIHVNKNGSQIGGANGKKNKTFPLMMKMITML